MRRLIAWMLLAPMVASAADIRLVLNWKPEAEFGGFYAAEQSKLYEKHGVKVRILPGGVGTPAVQMVAAGQAEFGISSADEVLISQDRGADVVALFSVYQTNPQGVMVRKDRGVSKLADVFHSGILAVQKGLPYFQFLEKKFGPLKAKVVPYLGGVGQLAENKEVAQQCFVTSEPILAEKKKLGVQTFLVAEAGFNPYTTVVVTRRAYAEKNKAVVESFKKAIVEGWQEYLKNPQPANERMNQLNPTMDLETLKQSAKIQQPLIENDVTRKEGLGSMRANRWAELGDQLKALGLIKTVKAPSHYILN